MNTQYSKKYIEIPHIVGRNLSCKKCISTWKLIFYINKCIFKESFKNTNVLLLITCFFLIILHFSLVNSIWSLLTILTNIRQQCLPHRKICRHRRWREERVYADNTITQSITVWYYSKTTISSDEPLCSHVLIV